MLACHVLQLLITFIGLGGGGGGKEKGKKKKLERGKYIKNLLTVGAVSPRNWIRYFCSSQAYEARA
jgi:hypothetical protein